MTESVNPLLNASGLIDYASVRPEHVAPAVETLSKNLEETLARVTAPETPATWEAVAEPLEKATLAFTRGWGVVGHLQSVVDTPALRDAYNAALPAVTQLFIDLSQNEALFAKYKAMKASDGFASLPPVRRRIIERELRDFRLSGAELPEAERARVKVVGEPEVQRKPARRHQCLGACRHGRDAPCRHSRGCQGALRRQREVRRKGRLAHYASLPVLPARHAVRG